MASVKICQVLRRTNLLRLKCNTKYSTQNTIQFAANQKVQFSRAVSSTVSAPDRSDWQCSLEEKSLTLSKSDTKLSFHYIWLRDHCRSPKFFNAVTNQRQQDTHAIDLEIKPKNVSVSSDSLEITWPDDHVSSYTMDWLQRNRYSQAYSSFLVDGSDRIFWGSSLAKEMPEMESFGSLMSNEQSLLNAYDSISRYGFALIKDTPTTEQAMGELADVLGRVKETLFGKTWELTVVSDSDEVLEHADTAYMNVALHGHTDGTYFFDQPRLQLFHIHQHIGSGGETLLVDAIGAAEKLRTSNPEAFEFLSNTHIPARYLEPGQHFRCLGPMIKVDPYSKEIYHVRVNGDDRDTLSCLSFNEVEQFYTHLHAYNSILRDKSNELWFKLTPGIALVTNNWRVLHGRAAFTGSRTLAGAYIENDEYISKHRVLAEKYRGGQS